MTEPRDPDTTGEPRAKDWPRNLFAYKDAETSIFLALGAASMLWDPRPEGVFDSTAAAALGDELVAHLRRRRLLP